MSAAPPKAKRPRGRPRNAEPRDVKVLLTLTRREAAVLRRGGENLTRSIRKLIAAVVGRPPLR